MKDRVPKYPGRVKITHADGTSEYVTLERADEPVSGNEGTPLNKATLLSDDTAAMLGFTSNEDPTVNDALQQLSKAAKPFLHSDLYMYIMQTHPMLYACPYKDAWVFDMTGDHKHTGRTISLTGNAQTITVYDNKDLSERI